MPGLFGIISKRGDSSREHLHLKALRMAEAMRSKPWLQAEVWGDGTFYGGRVHLGVLNPGPQPLSGERSALKAWFDGEVYSVSSEGGATPTLDEIHRWVNTPRSGLAAVDGLFAAACYNPDHPELFLANDRLGQRPLYYTETAEWFAYAAEVKALLAIRETLPDLDEISLRQFFGLGSLRGERTWWKGIELLPPASVWRISKEGKKTHRYWTCGDIKSDPRPTEDVLEEFGRLWPEAVAQRSKLGTMPQQLSGGLDSRMLLAELRDQGRDVVAITFGQPECADIRIARRCTSIAAVPHRVIEMTPENWWHGREEAIWQTDGMFNALHLHAATSRHEMRIGARYSPQNMAIDSLFGGSGLRPELMELSDWQRSPGELLRQKYKKANPFYDVEEVVAASIADTERYMDGPSRNCYSLLNLTRRSSIGGPLSYSAYCETVFPGMGIQLLQLVLGSLRDEQRVDGKFYRQFLATRYPTYYRDIPWQRTGRGLAESTPIKLARDLKQAAYRIRKRRIRLKTYYDYGHFLRLSKVKDDLSSGDLLSDDFLGGAARKALTSRPTRSFREAEALIAIITFETYLRQVAGTGMGRPTAAVDVPTTSIRSVRAIGNGATHRV